MKNRNWICFALDAFGLIALLGAGLALGAAVAFAAGANEALLLATFRNCLMLAIAALATARIYEIYHLLESSPDAPDEDAVMPASDNVEALPERKRLARAA